MKSAIVYPYLYAVRLAIQFGFYMTYASSIQVEIEPGIVQGYQETVLAKSLDIFLGIPYADPPIGDKRFKRPHKYGGWDGIWNATKFPNACYQVVDTMYGQFEGVDMWNPNTPMSEDCLYLNIWTPSATASGKAVMVWIYGGSFTSGSSSLDVYDGRILAVEGDVVVVSINYRMGALGFLTDGTEQIPGNMGLLDQTVALQWINNYIPYFGGDSNRITIFGESAGAVSCAFLHLSPLSSGFINGIILLSGTAVNRWAIDPADRAKEKYEMFAELMECDGSVEEIRACLMTSSPLELSAKTWEVSDGSRVPTPFGPIVDNYFLLDTPIKILQSGDFKNIPILLGSVTNEGSYFLMYNEDYTKYFGLENNALTKEEFKHVVRATIARNSTALVDLVAFQYMFDDRVVSASQANIGQFIAASDALVTDFAFICSMRRYSDIQSNAGNAVYMYMFEHRTSANPWPEWMGVMHGYEIDHIFGAPLNDTSAYHAQERILSQKILSYWTNFAKSGNPNIDDKGDSSTEVEWVPYTSATKDYILLDTSQIRMSKNYREKQCTFWEEVYPSIEAQLSDDVLTCEAVFTCVPSYFVVLCLLILSILYND